MNRGRDADQTMVTVLCLVGAVAGGFVGQVTRLYVFGEPLGFIFSAGGARCCWGSIAGATPPRAQVATSLAPRPS
jgi:hypothetical protein